ncbi:hypothetical protein HYS54_02175 [Candidatus Micrarchaeota archaeon]|nr:hypothetical protein [Candidatus Micrarchaeota archaeon]
MPTIQDQIKKLQPHNIVLVMTTADKYHAVNTEVLRYYLTKLRKTCIYVSMNRPAIAMQKVLGKEGVETKRVFFIDCITAIAEPHGMTRAGNIVFVTSPQNLTDMSIAISEAAEQIKKGERFLFFDSLSTLSLYNESESVAKFAHFLTTKLRELDIAAVFLLLEKETDQKIINNIAQFCDNVVEIK